MHQISWNSLHPERLNFRQVTCLKCSVTTNCLHHCLNNNEEIDPFNDKFICSKSNLKKEDWVIVIYDKI